MYEFNTSSPPYVAGSHIIINGFILIAKAYNRLSTINVIRSSNYDFSKHSEQLFDFLKEQKLNAMLS